VAGMANASFFMHLPVTPAPPPQPRATPEDLVGAGYLEGLLSDPSFEEGGVGWTLETSEATVVADFGRARSGRRHATLRTTDLTGDLATSIYQDTPGRPAGTRITLRAFVRSVSGAPVDVELVIWGTGGAATEKGATVFTASG